MEFHNPTLTFNSGLNQPQNGILTPASNHASLASMTRKNRIRQFRERLGLTQAALSVLAHTSQSQIDRLEKGERRLNDEWIERFTRIFACKPGDLFIDEEDDNSGHHTVLGGEFTPRSDALKSQTKSNQGIAEVDVRAGLGLGGEALAEYRPNTNGGVLLGDAVRGHWHLPDDYLRVELRATASDLTIIEVEGDSMAPTLQTGDRVMVNLRARVPSPPGIFALWDGLGVVCKRVEHIQGSDPPLLKIISDNERHSAYERTIEEAHIIGRVVWFARRM
ncbi:LexA family transcriptional regulator [Elstera cyanobacteriorum]|uniref:LexA family transcriptional regulator n=1 Tax=Elstera cyanobacteriorum TaxID=2022747 RepID=UPI0023545A2F|nr:LexA family transcriptional regulator [Elstera cyanobacteriorum]MCK6442308.1 helix-turn-helix domain-containing protein [Elstera cyanobacteriorum]